MNKSLYTYIIKVALTISTAVTLCSSAPIRFAWLTDTHVSDPDGKAAHDLSLCIRDINEVTRPDFVLVTGDLTDFGSDEQLVCVRNLLDSLTVPYYVVPGNHDAKWSESGCNSFVKTFGYEQFDFKAGGFRFLGCASGPDMRMAPALIPRSDLVWLENLQDCEKTIFVNHFPMDTSVLNYFDYRKVLRRNDARIVLGGHWHRNICLDYDGIPGILGRSSLSSSKTAAGYNLATIENDSLSVCERRVFPSSSVTLQPWYSRRLDKPQLRDPHDDPDGLPADYPWMRYDVNREDYSPWTVKENWSITENSDIAAGFAYDGKKKLWFASCDGYLRCVSTSGKKGWKAKLPGRIFSTPIYIDGLIVVGCADGGLYAFKARNGRRAWKVETGKSTLASPAVHNGRIYFGASDGCFRAVEAKTGRVIWTYDGVEGFVEDKAFVDSDQVVFGAWDRTLYSLDPDSGDLQWKWTVDKGSRMYSPAACWPVKSRGRIFIAVPDRRVYAIDCTSGKEVFHTEGGREAVGISEDGSRIFVKTMHNQAYALKADASSAADAEIWRVETGLGYDISPTSLVERDGVLFIGTDKGNIIGLDAESGAMLWKHKISIALVNPMTVTGSRKDGMALFASTMDGRIVRLDISNQQ